MLSQFDRRGAQAVTVNTQQDNIASLSLYQKAGFRRTGEEYPVYQYFPFSN
jgi:ribosomal protein S18 acetylase RimI-like enzyme